MKILFSSLLCFLFGFTMAQKTVPFGVVKDEDRYAHVRVAKEDYRKIVNKLKLGNLFAFEKVAEGETDWYWIKYPKKTKEDQPFERFETLENEGMVNKDRIVFIDQLPQYTASTSKNGKSLIFTDNTDPEIPTAKRTKVIIDIYPSSAKYKRQEKDPNGAIIKIDKAYPWGVDGKLPEDLMEIKSIRIQQPERGTYFLKDAIKNLFAPTKDFSKIVVTGLDKDHLFISMINGAGSSRYMTVWSIIKGKVTEQIVMHSPE